MEKEQKGVLLRIIVSAALTAALMLLPAFRGRGALFLVPYLLIGWDVLREAAEGLMEREPFDESFLMAVATVGAMALGEYAEGVAVMVLFRIGELFEDAAVDKSRRSIAELMDIRPDSADVEKADGGIETLPPESVAVGSVIAVKPGGRIPLDGRIISGTSALDCSALTGESVPRTVRPGDEVRSGCINLSGLLRVETTKEYGQSTASKILELVENAAGKKAKSENFITAFARWYTPAVCLCALGLFLLPPLVSMALGGAARWSAWLYRALTFLVISCPCALVISIPLTFFAALGGASRAGVLIKGSNYVETLSKLRCALFDKTGTVTEGVFEVTELRPAPGMDENELLELAAHAECASTHPAARSLLRAYGKEPDRARVESVEELGGHGVTALVDGRPVAAGNGKLMERLHIPFDGVATSGTAVYVAADGRYAGCIIVSDRLKKNAAAAIARLKALGVKKTVMLTGDSRPAAEEAARAAGMDAVYAELLPDGKAETAERLLKAMPRGETLCFAGDGINDAPVLALADVGIAMGALGSDAAIEAADVVIMDDDPAKIADAIALSRRCMRIVRENIALAIGVKAACLALSALGLANMWAAIFADVGVMVLAVLNALRAMKNPT